MSTKLLDISYWQGTLDFNKIKNDGYNYIILRAGYGTTKDPKFDEYATNCKKYGIKIGAYWFCYSTNVSEVKKEVRKCISVIKPYDIDLPVFFDFEYDTVEKAKEKGVNLGMTQCSQFTITFCEAIKKAGYTPGFYANTDYYKNYFNSTVKNKGYVFWLAHYKNNYLYHEPPIDCDFFQWTDRGSVSGINGKNFDMDVCFSEKYLNCRNVQNSNIDLTQGGINNMSNIIQNVINDAVDFAVRMANDNTHGYSQAVRSLYNITNPTSFDCSSLVCTAYYYAFVKNGISPTPKDMGCSYTGNMMNLTKCGFEVVATNQTAHAQMKKGDIELNTTYHTALAIDGDNIVHARSSEGTSDTKDGSGNEIRTQAWYLYSHGWTYRLRFTGKGLNLSSTSSSTTKPKIFKRTNSGTVRVNSSLNVRSTPGGTVIGQVYNGNRFDVDENQTSGNWLYVKFSTIGTGYISKDYVVLDKKKNNSNNSSSNNTSNNSTTTYKEWTGKVTASKLNVRSWAGTEYGNIKSYPYLAKGNRVRVIGELKANDESKWYKIAINNFTTKNKDIIGFVSAEYIKKV